MVQGSKENAFWNLWGEHERAKGSKGLPSVLFHRLCNTDRINIKTVRLVKGGCGDQNKNTYLMTMMSSWISPRAPLKIKENAIIFPVAEHCFIPPDRMLALIEKDVNARKCIIPFGTIVHLDTVESSTQDCKSLLAFFF